MEDLKMKLSEKQLEDAIANGNTLQEQIKIILKLANEYIEMLKNRIETLEKKNLKLETKNNILSLEVTKSHLEINGEDK